MFSAHFPHGYGITATSVTDFKICVAGLFDDINTMLGGARIIVGVDSNT